jgi:hypothetical protein
LFIHKVDLTQQLQSDANDGEWAQKQAELSIKHLSRMKKEDLYAENMQVKKQINEYKDANMRLKTRMR